MIDVWSIDWRHLSSGRATNNGEPSAFYGRSWSLTTAKNIGRISSASGLIRPHRNLWRKTETENCTAKSRVIGRRRDLLFAFITSYYSTEFMLAIRWPAWHWDLIDNVTMASTYSENMKNWLRWNTWTTIFAVNTLYLLKWLSRSVVLLYVSIAFVHMQAYLCW